MDPAERVREVTADLARWRDRRWCRCRISPSQIDAIVRAIDPERKPRTNVVDEPHAAARLSIQLREDLDAKREPDNFRLSATAARIAGELMHHAQDVTSRELGAIHSTVEGAAWAARNAIEAALNEITRDCSILAFGVRHTFTSPVYAFTYRGQSLVKGFHRPCPYLGVSDLYLAGCYPMGYIDDHFAVFAP
jgi:hypothetical protein